MAKKKKPVAKRPAKKPKTVKTAVRGKAGAKKAAKAVKALKKKPIAKKAAPKKKVVSLKTAPKRKAPIAKKPIAALPKKPASKPVVPSKTRETVRAAAVKPKAEAAVKAVAPPKPAPKPAKPAPAPAPTVAPAPKPVAAPVVRPAERKPLKERVVMEFEVHSNPNVLFELLSTPSGFSEWYCDDVDVHGDVFTFKWGGDEETVTMIGRKAPEVIRFHRADDDDPAAFFEFRIRIDEMTNEVALIVTDHAWPGESGNVRSLWASQIANLTRVLGA